MLVKIRHSFLQVRSISNFKTDWLNKTKNELCELHAKIKYSYLQKKLTFQSNFLEYALFILGGGSKKRREPSSNDVSTVNDCMHKQKESSLIKLFVDLRST